MAMGLQAIHYVVILQIKYSVPQNPRFGGKWCDLTSSPKFYLNSNCTWSGCTLNSSENSFCHLISIHWLHTGKYKSSHKYDYSRITNTILPNIHGLTLTFGVTKRQWCIDLDMRFLPNRKYVFASKEKWLSLATEIQRDITDSSPIIKIQVCWSCNVTWV